VHYEYITFKTRKAPNDDSRSGAFIGRVKLGACDWPAEWTAPIFAGYHRVSRPAFQSRSRDFGIA
jgi:hypothetical protein